MNNANRRSFIKTAGAGAAAAGAIALVPSGGTSALGASAPVAATAGATAVQAEPLSLPAAAAGAMVAYVKDVATGEVSVMVEGREVTVTDHQLVAKLAHVLHSTSKA